MKHQPVSKDDIKAIHRTVARKRQVPKKGRPLSAFNGRVYPFRGNRGRRVHTSIRFTRPATLPGSIFTQVENLLHSRSYIERNAEVNDYFFCKTSEIPEVIRQLYTIMKDDIEHFVFPFNALSLPSDVLTWMIGCYTSVHGDQWNIEKEEHEKEMLYYVNHYMKHQGWSQEMDYSFGISWMTNLKKKDPALYRAWLVAFGILIYRYEISFQNGDDLSIIEEELLNRLEEDPAEQEYVDDVNQDLITYRKGGDAFNFTKELKSFSEKDMVKAMKALDMDNKFHKTSYPYFETVLAIKAQPHTLGEFCNPELNEDYDCQCFPSDFFALYWKYDEGDPIYEWVQDELKSRWEQVGQAEPFCAKIPRSKYHLDLPVESEFPKLLLSFFDGMYDLSIKLAKYGKS